LPFFNQQLFGLVPLRKDASWVKPIWLRLVELVVLYFAVGVVAHLLEAGIGNARRAGILCHHRLPVPGAGLPRLRDALPAQAARLKQPE
jgi:hypothetical protein